jgi:hypothetical protein
MVVKAFSHPLMKTLLQTQITITTALVLRSKTRIKLKKKSLMQKLSQVSKLQSRTATRYAVRILINLTKYILL